VLDAQLSDAEPAALLQQIKEAHPQLPVIMVLPPGAKAELEGTRAMSQSAQSYVTKSLGWETRLPLMVERCLREAQAHTDIRRAASELSELRQHYQSILAYTREALLALNPSGFIVHFSPAAERILGYPATQVIGEHISIFYDAPESIRTILAALAETDSARAVSVDEIARLPGILRVIAAQGDAIVASRPPGGTATDKNVSAPDESARDAPGQSRLQFSASGFQPPASSIQYEAFLRHAEGHFLIFEITMAAVRDEEGALIGYLSFCHELTEERQAQRELLRTKSLLQTVMDTAPVNILIVGATGNIVSANNSVERSLGYVVSGLIGEQASVLTTQPERLRGIFEQTLETGEPQQAMLEMLSADGVTQAHQLFTSLMRNSQGEATGIIAITTDLSQQKQQIDALRAEIEQLRAEEAKARALFETAATLGATDDLYGVFAQIAQSAALYLGFDEVTVYRADPEQGLLVGVVTAQAPSRSRRSGFPPDSVGPSRLPPASSAVRALSNVNINLTAGETSVATPRLTVLVQIRTPGEDSNLVGVISATFPVGQTPRLSEPSAAIIAEAEAREAESLSPHASKQVHLLRSLARLASVANESARMERLRSQLISSVSHELRTPLAAIRAYNELLLDGDAGPINDEQRLFLSRVEATSIQLNRILEDLLDLSRMRAGELSVHKVTTDVAACIQHIINTAEPEAAKKHITVESRFLSELPPIVTDPDRLSQVLMNLVDNAIKYGNEGGSVLVEAQVGLPADLSPMARKTEGEAEPYRGTGDLSHGDELVISVADNGPGIPPDDLDKIFNEFQRGSHTTSGRAKGAGLGLAIVSRLVRLLGGTISVDSTVGEGSTFYLRFPLAQLTPGEE